MRDWVIPPPLARPVPRRARPTWRTYAVLLVMVGVIIVPLYGFYTLVLVPWHQKKMLEARSVEISGTVVARQQASNDRRGNYNDPFIVYVYTPKELSNTPNHDVRVGHYVSEEVYLAYRLGDAVPLVYDRADPKHAVPKSTKSPPSNTGVLALIFLPFIGFWAILSAWMLWLQLRERWLLRWGKAAKATITGESEDVYKGARNAKIAYTFQDDSGARWTGQATIPMGRADDPSPLPELIGLPTAIYDPRNGAKNMLYPGVMYRLVE